MRWAAIVLLGFAAGGAGAADGPAQSWLRWDTAIAPLPDESGLAGPFVGVSDDALIVAGGANFPETNRWQAAKQFHDRIFVLDRADGEWHTADARLPMPMAYGMSITTPYGLICIGGSDAERCFADVFVLRWDRAAQQVMVGNKLVDVGEMEAGAAPLPPLPMPLAFAAGVMVEQSIYVAGGQTAMTGPASGASRGFYRLDLSKRRDAAAFRWESLPWPDGAEPRILPVAAAQSDGQTECFYLFSGRNMQPGAAPPTLLRDAWRFRPRDGSWRRLADVPSCIMGGAAVRSGSGHVLALGGDDGEHFGKADILRDDHPGFARGLLYAYHTVTDTWVIIGQLPPWPPVTTAAVWWKGGIVVPTGEIRPRVRSPMVHRAAVVDHSKGFRSLDYAVLFIYFAALVGMGIYFSKREKSTADFFIAGRRIPWWAAGLSIFGTQLSAITFMAIPAKTFAADWLYFLGNMMIVAAAPFVVWLFLPFFRQLNVTTAYEYLERRFSAAPRLLGAAAFVLFQFGRMGIVLYLPALALATVTGIDVYLCIALMGVLATVYTVLGGIEAVIWTDVLQVFVLVGGALASLVVIVMGVDGGAGRIIHDGLEAGKLRLAAMDFSAASIATTAVWVIMLGKFLESMMSYTSDQAVVQRYLTTKDQQAAARSIWTNAVLVVPSTLLFFSVGTGLWAFYKTHPHLLNPAGSADDIFPWFIAQQLPAGLSGLVVAGLFAASMSSLDSSMNSMATVLTHDFYRRIRPGASDHHCLLLAKWLTLLLGAIGTGAALYMAYLSSKSMWDQYTKVIGLFGGGMAGLFALAVLTRRANSFGAVIGFLSSAGILFAVTQSRVVNFFLYAGVGMISCFAVGYVVSILTGGCRKPLGGLTIHTKA